MSIGPSITLGQLTARVDLEKLKTATVAGELQNDYEPLAVGVRAKIVPRSSFTIKQADRVSEGATHLVTILYRPEFRGSGRVIVQPGCAKLDVLGAPRPDDMTRPRFLEMECTEVD